MTVITDDFSLAIPVMSGPVDIKNAVSVKDAYQKAESRRELNSDCNLNDDVCSPGEVAVNRKEPDRVLDCTITCA